MELDLFKICADGDLESVQKLINESFDFNINISCPKDHAHRQMTPLSIAVQHGNVKLVKLLIAEGKADVNFGNYGGGNAINVAAWLSESQDNLEIAQILIDNQIDLGNNSHLQSYIYTPLSIACASRNFQVAKLIVDNIGDTDYAQDYFSSALYALVRRPHEVSRNEDAVLEVAKLLMSKGANVNYANDGWSTLHCAINNNDLFFTKLLVDNGADVKVLNHNGTIIDEAAMYGDHEMQSYVKSIYNSDDLLTIIGNNYFSDEC